MKISVLNLVLIIAVLASSIGTFGYMLEMTHLKAELKSLRQEAGYLSVEDRTKIHAVRIQTFHENVWSYRIFLPTNQTYYLGTKFNSLSPNWKLPVVKKPPKPFSIVSIKNGTVIGIKPGEYIVSLSIQKIENSWKYSLNIREPGSGGVGTTSIKTIACTQNEWPNTSFTLMESGVTDQENKTVDRKLVLLNLRAGIRSGIASSNSKQGALFWISKVE